MRNQQMILEMRGLSFWYPTSVEPTLNNISLSIAAGEIIVLCGPSGCGKSTLLRHMKKNRIPFGKGVGMILFDGMDLEMMTDRDAASRVGYVGQDPDSQIVTDTVWHELAFGLESLGIKGEEIRRRTAEMAEYLGISSLFRKRTEELSGGQKQLLNLASVMVMKPDLLILDEPTAQMDPVAANRFIQTILRLNQDLGTTVILSEQRLEEVLPAADRVILMQEGEIRSMGKVSESALLLAECEEKSGSLYPVRGAFPTALNIYSACGGSMLEPSPLSVREGRIWLKDRLSKHGKNSGERRANKKINKDEIKNRKEIKNEKEKEKERDRSPVLFAKNVSYAYEKGEPVLRDFSIEVEKGSFYSVLGGNGSGKTTALKVLAGIYSQSRRGSVRREGNVCYLAQNPESLFTELSVEEELAEMLRGEPLEKMRDEVEQMLQFLDISTLRKRNPMDLSGGEKQRLALGKILLRKPDILLLDEPTKGLDAAFKQRLSSLFLDLRQQGITLLMVSHDLEFCAENATHCGLLFDGCMISSGTVREFFSGNSFYTTAATRIADGILPGCMLRSDIIERVQEW